MVIYRLLRPDVLCVAFGLPWLLQGIWAFLAPRSFFDTLATFEPYNRHLLHDIGALEIAVGVGACAVALTKRAVNVGLAGLATFEVLHLLSHIIDRDLGGRPAFDITALGVPAVLTVLVLAASIRDPSLTSPSREAPTQHRP